MALNGGKLARHIAPIELSAKVARALFRDETELGAVSWTRPANGVAAQTSAVCAATNIAETQFRCCKSADIFRGGELTLKEVFCYCRASSRKLAFQGLRAKKCPARRGLAPGWL
jgi:hypothetical protein